VLALLLASVGNDIVNSFSLELEVIKRESFSYDVLLLLLGLMLSAREQKFKVKLCL
jgi:hypothetical protein